MTAPAEIRLYLPAALVRYNQAGTIGACHNPLPYRP